MIIIDEKTGCTMKIAEEAFNLIFDHRLRLPKPKDVQAYHVENGKKIPNILHTDSLRHVQKECFYQMVEQLKKQMLSNFDKYRDGEAKLSDLTCGNVSIKRSVHVGFWKFLVEMYCKKATYTVDNLNDLQLEDSDNFNITILSAEIKERPPVNAPMQISRAELERG